MAIQMPRHLQLALALSVVTAVAMLVPNEAAAGSTCDDSSSGGSSSGGSSSGSSSSGSSSYSSDDSSSSDSTPACEQTTKTVGRAECRKFGDGWDRSKQPRIRLGLGLVHQSLSLANMKFDGTSTHDGNPHNYNYDPTLTGTPSRAELIGGSFDFHVLLGQAHIGFGASITGGSSDGAAQVSNSGLRMRSGLAMQMEVKVVAGYATRFGKWGVMGELQSGMRATIVDIETRLGNCISNAMSSEISALVRPQFTVQRWLSPWITTDLSVGSDLFQERDLSMTLSLTAHSRSYDGIY